MTNAAEHTPREALASDNPSTRYCFDGCPGGAEPVLIGDAGESGEPDDHTGLVTGIGFVIAALETAVWLAFL